MKNYFIFSYEDFMSSDEKIKVTVIFIHQQIIRSQNALSQEINTFFQENSLTDKLVVLLPDYLDVDSKKFIVEDYVETFIRIPGKSNEYFEENLLVCSYDDQGGQKKIFGKKIENEVKFYEVLYRNGNTTIFQKNGGVVESTPDHHFVFPSNKHCSKFLRTGNVLVHQAEVFFLSVQLLKYFDDKKYVYCDTSSINTLPYAVLELKRRFGKDFLSPTIYSFSSYDFFESSEENFPRNALILISSSTSGNIIDRLVQEQRAEKEQIKVIYFLGEEKKYLNKKENIICNLTYDEKKFPQGEQIFESADNASLCNLCKNNSRPINIRGDVFLTIQPKVHKHLLTIKQECIPSTVSPFVNEFRKKGGDIEIIKVYHKDNDANRNYEIYFDYINLISNVENFKKYKSSLDKSINKYVPANLKYIVHLPDDGSQKLAEYIVNTIPKPIDPKLIKLESNFTENFDSQEKGAVLVVASCITTGKKLLQISRLLRKFDGLDSIYFVGVFRPLNESFASDLINDLKKGISKADERPFIAIETIYTAIRQQNTSWSEEISFIEELLSENDEDSNLYKYFDIRINFLRQNKSTRGFANNLFLKKYDGQELKLRKSFAFWKFPYKESEINDSEVYFTISSIINNLENREINNLPSLKQTNYVRNLLSPRNFHRFNDGIIQASLLRASKVDYLSYDLDDEANLQMTEFLLSVISQFESEDGEALMEFLLAIGMKKLKLKKNDLEIVLQKSSNISNQLISEFSNYLISILVMKS